MGISSKNLESKNYFKIYDQIHGKILPKTDLPKIF